LQYWQTWVLLIFTSSAYLQIISPTLYNRLEVKFPGSERKFLMARKLKLRGKYVYHQRKLVETHMRSPQSSLPKQCFQIKWRQHPWVSLWTLTGIHMKTNYCPNSQSAHWPFTVNFLLVWGVILSILSVLLTCIRGEAASISCLRWMAFHVSDLLFSCRDQPLQPYLFKWVNEYKLKF